MRDVTVRVGSRTLLDSVGFGASPREVVAIIGPNGAGKTTLLEVIAGLRRAQGGSVALEGAPFQHFAERAGRIAYLPDGGELPAELRVRGIIDHALRFRPRSSGLVADLHLALELGALLDVPAGVLSRGERQRVTLFCALAVERPIVILDEPFGAFDPLKVRDVLSAVRRVADSGAAVIATVHDLGSATKIANRVLILAGGRKIAWGTLESLRADAGVPGGTLEEVFVALLTERAHAP